MSRRVIVAAVLVLVIVVGTIFVLIALNEGGDVDKGDPNRESLAPVPARTLLAPAGPGQST